MMPHATLDPHYIAATLQEGYDRVLKHEETFCVFDRSADINRHAPGEQGLYHEGTRFLSRLLLDYNGERPVLLNSSIRADNSLMTANLTNPDVREGGEVALPRGSVHMLRATAVRGACLHESLQLINYSGQTVEARISFRFEADFRDIFEIRGERRAERGRTEDPDVGHHHAAISYLGLDGVRRRAMLVFNPPPTAIDADHAAYAVRLEPRQGMTVGLVLCCETEGEPNDGRITVRAARDSRRAAARERHTCTVRTSNEHFNVWLDRSIADLDMLCTHTPAGPFPFAGVPWFSTYFGRDALITSLEVLWRDPSIARATLGYLAATQAADLDPDRDAEPGKILHESRRGEMAALREIPFGRYYGTIDATPLFVMLAGEYHAATGDLDFVESLWPNIERALEWIERWGDPDSDGFIEYHRKTDEGLLNQGWKDSGDSIAHAGGDMARGPIALCEVQGYAYAARLAASRLARALGRPGDADRLAAQAQRLAEKFDSAFWTEERGCYALALDGNKRACRVRSSNAGHVLFCGLAPRHRAGVMAAALTGDDMFTGWGIRTLSSSESYYNPMSYHNGSVWPHDTALVAAGLARYGYTDHAARILHGLLDASVWFDLQRLPELFCGFARRPGEGPTRYPAACAPQAWASASLFMLLGAALGLTIDAPAKRVRLARPVLPVELQEIDITGLRVGDATADLAITNHDGVVGVRVKQRDGDLEVVVVN